MRLPRLAELLLALPLSQGARGFVEQPARRQHPRRSSSVAPARSPFHRVGRRPALPVGPGQQTFDWTAEWYPVSPVRDLSATRPNRIALLGQDFCVWYHPPTGTWRAFEDSCPHRGVPLSEGRIEAARDVGGGGSTDAFLQCAYHGWEFAADGTCSSIPQLGSAFRPASWPAACATAFPACVAQDLLWIFPSRDRPELAASKAPATIPQLDDGDKVDATALYCRDLPYSWETLVENLCDPTHVAYAHHGSMRGADRYGPPESKRADLRVTSLGRAGFEAEKDPPPAGGRYRVRFRPPCLLYYDIVNSRAMGTPLGDEDRSGVYLGLGSYCVPTGPGASRLIARFPFSLPAKAAMRAMRMTPRWITHLSQNIVIDSDAVFLAAQDDRLRQWRAREAEEGSSSSSSSSPLKHYYLPARSDAMVVAFRRWLEKFGGGGPPVSARDFGPGAAPCTARTGGGGDPTAWSRAPARSGRDALLDRYRQHTEICSSCRAAHARLGACSRACRWGSFAALALAAAAPARSKGLSALALLLFAVPRVALRPLIQRLECVPWPREEWLRSPDGASARRKVEVPP
jgi:phenylpropionate dioxygenase-like ring-hydroxylating dioxygenase large terminal subunit